MRNWAKSVIWKVIALAVIIRLIVVLYVALGPSHGDGFVSPDSRSYRVLAASLARSGSFAADGHAELERTPGYPLALVPGVWLGSDVAWGVGLNILLAMVITAAIFRIGLQWFGSPAIASAAALLYALDPLSIIYATQLLSETLFTAVIVWGISLVWAYTERPRIRTIAAATLILSLAVYVRPAAIFFPAGLGILCVAWLWVRHRLTGPAAAAGALAVLGTFAVVVSPWWLRNRQLDYPGVSAISAVNLYFYDGAAVSAALAHQDFQAVQQQFGYGDTARYLAAHPTQRTLSLGSRYAAMQHEGARMVGAHPMTYARLHLSGMFRTAAHPGSIEILRALGVASGSGAGSTGPSTARPPGVSMRSFPGELALTLGLAAVLAAVWLAAAVGALSTWRTHPAAVLLLGATIGYFIAIAGGPAGESRFRVPVMPALVTLAAAGCVRGIRSRSSNSLPSRCFAASQGTLAR